jgi:hypothetical protein
MLSMLLTLLVTYLAISVSASLYFPCTAHAFLPERLSNPGSPLYFSRDCTKYDAHLLSDKSWNCIRPDTRLQLKGRKNQYFHPAAWHFVHWFPRYASTIIYRFIALLQLLYRWQHQSQKLWIQPRIMETFQNGGEKPCDWWNHQVTLTGVCSDWCTRRTEWQGCLQRNVVNFSHLRSFYVILYQSSSHYGITVWHALWKRDWLQTSTNVDITCVLKRANSASANASASKTGGEAISLLFFEVIHARRLGVMFNFTGHRHLAHYNVLTV